MLGRQRSKTPKPNHPNPLTPQNPRAPQPGPALARPRAAPPPPSQGCAGGGHATRAGPRGRIPQPGGGFSPLREGGLLRLAGPWRGATAAPGAPGPARLLQSGAAGPPGPFRGAGEVRAGSALALRGGGHSPWGGPLPGTWGRDRAGGHQWGEGGAPHNPTPPGASTRRPLGGRGPGRLAPTLGQPPPPPARPQSSQASGRAGDAPAPAPCQSVRRGQEQGRD